LGLAVIPGKARRLPINRWFVYPLIFSGMDERGWPCGIEIERRAADTKSAFRQGAGLAASPRGPKSPQARLRRGATDGVTEAENPQGEEFGVERLSALIPRGHVRSAEALVSHILEHVADFWRGVGFNDDVTVLAVKCDFRAA
jgi:hypothetical protein